MIKVSFTGHRPKQLFGTYDTDNPKAKLLASKLLETIESLIINREADTFITGGALGADQIAYICVHHLKKKHPHIKNILAIPYKKQPKGWKEQLEKAKKNNWKNTVSELEKTVHRYQRMVELADEVVYVDEIPKYQPRTMKKEEIGEHSNAKLQLRNIYMVDHSEIVVAVFDGKKGGTYNCVEAAKKRKKEIIVLDPNNDFEVQT
jgi:uncharacterized phage-like protein YoqJ